MGTNPNFPAGRLPHQTGFVLVNGRVPRRGQRSVLCGGIVEKGYARDLQTWSIYCEAECFTGGSHMTMSLLNGRERKVS
jgi:hypothetical protein